MMRKLFLIITLIMLLSNLSFAAIVGSFPLTLQCNFQKFTCKIPPNNTIGIQVSLVNAPRKGGTIQTVKLVHVRAFAKAYSKSNNKSEIMQLAKAVYGNNNGAQAILYAGPNVVADSTLTNPQNGWQPKMFTISGVMTCSQKKPSTQKCILINNNNQ